VEITQYLQATKGILDEGQTTDSKTQSSGAAAVYNTANGTKSTTALGSMANLVNRESALNQVTNSQMMFMRGSMGGPLHPNAQTVSTVVGPSSQTIQNNSNSNRQNHPSQQSQVH
jgi:hypothetical protein